MKRLEGITYNHNERGVIAELAWRVDVVRVELLPVLGGGYEEVRLPDTEMNYEILQFETVANLTAFIEAHR